MENEVMNVANGNSKVAIGAIAIGAVGAGLGVLGKFVFDKVMAKRAVEETEAETNTEE